MHITRLTNPSLPLRRLPAPAPGSTDKVELGGRTTPLELIKAQIPCPRQDPKDPRFGLACSAFLRPDPFFSETTRLVVHAGRTGNNPNGVIELPTSKLNMIATDQLLSRKDQVLLGFGSPRVSLLIPGQNGYQRLQSSPFFSKKSRIISGETIQSGVFIRPRNLPAEALQALTKAMNEQVGQRSISSARANAEVLSQAGFTSGGRKLSGKLLPFRLFRQIAQKGLEFQGRPVAFDIISTNNKSLDDHFRKVIGQELHSPFDPKVDPEVPAPNATNAYPDPCQPSDPNAPQVRIRNSRPGLVGSSLRSLLGAHILWEALPDPKLADINQFLPQVLKDKFHDDKPLTRGEKIKSIIFKPAVVSFLRKNMAKAFDDGGQFAPRQLASMLRVAGEGEEVQADSKGRIKYNLVICGDQSPRGTHITIARLNVKNNDSKADDVLSKHVLLAGYDPDVRFAGECWAERYSQSDGSQAVRIHVNNNSGTYRPNGQQAQAAGEFLRKALPGVEIVVHETTPPPPTGKPDYLRTYAVSPDQATALRGLAGQKVTLNGEEYKIHQFKTVEFDTEFYDTGDRKLLNGGGMLRSRTRYKPGTDQVKTIDIESKLPPAQPGPFQDRAKGFSFDSMEEWKAHQTWVLSPESTDEAVGFARTMAGDGRLEAVACKHSMRELFLLTPSQRWFGFFKPQFILSLDTNSMRAPGLPRPQQPGADTYQVLTPQAFTKLPWTKKVEPERIDQLNDLCRQLSQKFQLQEVGMSPYAEGMAHWKKG